MPGALRPLRLAAFALGALAPLAAEAQGADVVAIQAREARNADNRTLAALERFRAALVARYGADPRLTMLTISEVEGAALVQRSTIALPEFVILRGDRWMSTEARQLKPWASPADAAANAFPLSAVRGDAIRAWLDLWRKMPGQTTDFVGEYGVGYEPALSRLVVRATVASMTTGKFTQHAFDAGTGAPLPSAPSRR